MRISDWSSDVCSSDLLYAGAAIGLVLAALAGFGVARMTGPSAPTAETETAADAAPTDTVVITQDGIKTSGIGLAQAASGGVAGIILASATVEATDRKSTRLNSSH